eukprot:gene7345-7557_t
MEEHFQSGSLKNISLGMPRLHLAAYRGDLQALQDAIRDCEDVNAVINLPNQHQHTVVGVTPLYLAAQAGHKEACVLLVQAGADILRQCTVPESGDIFGPTDIAFVHFNFKTWVYLLSVKRQRLAKAQSRKQCDSGLLREPLMLQQQAYAI